MTFTLSPSSSPPPMHRSPQFKHFNIPSQPSLPPGPRSPLTSDWLHRSLSLVAFSGRKNCSHGRVAAVAVGAACATLVLPRWPRRCLGQLDAMKMKVAAIGGIADTIRMSGVPESMKRGEGGGDGTGGVKEVHKRGFKAGRRILASSQYLKRPFAKCARAAICILFTRLLTRPAAS